MILKNIFYFIWDLMFLQNPAASLCSPSPSTPSPTYKRRNGPFSILGEPSMCSRTRACVCVCTHTVLDKNTQRPTADTHRNTQQLKHRHEFKHSVLILKHHTKTETQTQSHSDGKHKSRSTVGGDPAETWRETDRQRGEERKRHVPSDRSEATFML